MEPHEYDLMHELERSYWWYPAKRSLVVNMIRHWIRPAGPVRLLDVGCGTGANLPALRRFGTVTGCDVAEPAVRYARGRGFADVVLQPDPHRLPFPDGRFEIVAALEVLEHVDDDAALLRDIGRVLAPHGTVLLSVPAHPSLWSIHDEAAHHRRRYRKADLLKTLAAAGFEVERTTYLNGLLFPLIVPVRWIRDRIVRRRGQTTSDFHVRIPRWLNALFRFIFASEWQVIRRMPLPVGLSLCCMARRTPAPARA